MSPQENSGQQMSPEEFAKHREIVAKQMETLVMGMDFPRVVYAIGALIALMASQLPPATVSNYLNRARAEALAATPEQLAAGK